MTTYEKCQTVRRVIVNRAAEVMNCTDWSDAFAAKQIQEIPEVLAEEIGKINIAELTAPQMDDLGFVRWSEDNPMRLIPLWLFKFLPDEIESECINGERAVRKTVEMNNDHRFGCMAYGIWPNMASEVAKAMAILEEFRTNPDRSAMRDFIGVGKRVLYEGDPDDPEGIVRVMPDGTRERGTIVNRTFIPQK